MAVLLNKPDEFTRLCVDQLLPGWKFAMVLGAGTSLPRKPDPAGAREVARRLGVAPGEILYLGDTDTDMQTAVAAGMFPARRAVGLPHGRRVDRQRCTGAVERPLDLLRILDDARR